MSKEVIVIVDSSISMVAMCSLTHFVLYSILIDGDNIIRIRYI